MNKKQNLISLAIKRLTFFSLPMVLLIYILNKLILRIEASFPWTSVIIYASVIGFTTMGNYRHKSMEEEINDFDYLKNLIKEGRWEILEEGENKLSLKPRFDFPYGLLSKETVEIQYWEHKASFEGARYYIENLKKDISGKGSMWTKRIASIAILILTFALISIPIFSEIGIFWDLRQMYHNHQMKNADKIKIEGEEFIGNTVANINNYGFGAENEDYIFYVEGDLNLVRAKKEFQDKTYLIQKSSGSGIGGLNIVDDWIFYSSGQSLNRMRIDGREDQIIYEMGYLSDIHIKDNWIYFINPLDKVNIYRMDVNGQNLERLLKVEASDIAIYDDRLFYSYEVNGQGYVKSISLDGGESKVELETKVYDLIRWQGYYYYIGEDYKLFRNEVGTNNSTELLVDDKVSSYIVTDAGIFYSLHSEDVGYPGEGLYRMELDGSGNTLVLDTKDVNGFTQVGDWLLFHSSDNNLSSNPKRLNLLSGDIETIE